MLRLAVVLTLLAAVTARAADYAGGRLEPEAAEPTVAIALRADAPTVLVHAETGVTCGRVCGSRGRTARAACASGWSTARR